MRCTVHHWIELFSICPVCQICIVCVLGRSENILLLYKGLCRYNIPPTTSPPPPPPPRKKKEHEKRRSLRNLRFSPQQTIRYTLKIVSIWYCGGGWRVEGQIKPNYVMYCSTRLIRLTTGPVTQRERLVNCVRSLVSERPIVKYT